MSINHDYVSEEWEVGCNSICGYTSISLIQLRVRRVGRILQQHLWYTSISYNYVSEEWEVGPGGFSVNFRRYARLREQICDLMYRHFCLKNVPTLLKCTENSAQKCTHLYEVYRKFDPK